LTTFAIAAETLQSEPGAGPRGRGDPRISPIQKPKAKLLNGRAFRVPVDELADGLWLFGIPVNHRTWQPLTDSPPPGA
jgi:hypothetical protein